MIGYYQIGKQRVAAIENDCAFPSLEHALTNPNGLLAIGGDLNPTRLLNAYKMGIFPWYNEDEPVMWYSPNPRMVLFPLELKISKSLHKTIQKQVFTVKLNTDFRAVITACGQTLRKDQPGTWISPDIIEAYCKLHALGFAICAESWLNNTLVGGCYGVKIGRMFYGESMFHTHTDASKVAFVHLVDWLKNQQVELIDCQMKTQLLASFGGREITRETFALQLKNLIHYSSDALSN